MAEFKTTYTVAVAGSATQVAMPTGIISSGNGARGWNVRAIEINNAVTADPAVIVTAAGPVGWMSAISSAALGNGVVPLRSAPQTIMRFDRQLMTTAAGVAQFEVSWPYIWSPQEDEVLVAAENLYWYAQLENMATVNWTITVHWDSVALSELDLYRIRNA